MVLVHEQQPSKRHSMPWPPWPAQSSCAVGADDGERVAERTDGSDASAQRGRREQLFANALADLDASFADRERIGYAVEAAASPGLCGGRVGRQRARVMK